MDVDHERNLTAEGRDNGRFIRSMRACQPLTSRRMSGSRAGDRYENPCVHKTGIRPDAKQRFAKQSEGLIQGGGRGTPSVSNRRLSSTPTNTTNLPTTNQYQQVRPTIPRQIRSTKQNDPRRVVAPTNPIDKPQRFSSPRRSRTIPGEPCLTDTPTLPSPERHFRSLQLGSRRRPIPTRLPEGDSRSDTGHQFYPTVD